MPAAHVVQDVAPVAPANEPAGQEVHIVLASVLAYLPVLQVTQFDRPPSLWYVPGGQLVHPDDPGDAENLPAGHTLQAVAPEI